MSTINFSQVVQQMLAVSNKISDLIFSPGRPPQVELIGKLTPVQIQGMEMLTPAHTTAISKALIGSNKMAEESL
jgi:twitching motility protein PilT